MSETQFTPIVEGAWKNIEDLREKVSKDLEKAQEAQQTFLDARDTFQKSESQLITYVKAVADALGVDIDTHRLEDRRFVPLSEEEIAAIKEEQAEEGVEDVEEAVVVEEE